MVLLATLAVGACATTPPPAAPPVVATATPPPDRLPPPPKAPVPPPPKPVDLHWAFSASADMCTATASGPGGSLQIQTTTARQILLTATFGPAAHARRRPAKFTFSGAAGDWSMPGTWQGNAFTSSRPLDERGVASVLGLLGGGTAAVSAGSLRVGSARLPPSSAEGSAWVVCPKQMMAPS